MGKESLEPGVIATTVIANTENYPGRHVHEHKLGGGVLKICDCGSAEYQPDSDE